MTRRDKVRQAVSYWRARQTEEWNSLEARPGSFQGRYSFEEIASLRDYVGRCERGVASLFAVSRVSPHVVVYEDFVVSYRETAKQVLDFLGHRLGHTASGAEAAEAG